MLKVLFNLKKPTQTQTVCFTKKITVQQMQNLQNDMVIHDDHISANKTYKWEMHVFLLNKINISTKVIHHSK